MYKALNEQVWKEFKIEDLFCVEIGKNVDGNKVNKVSGKTAYITRKECNNGLDGFVDYKNDFLNLDYPVITIGNETATPFVQTSPFYTGTKVNILKPKEQLLKHALFFIAQCLKQHRNKYSYSYTINSTRLRKQIILLPSTKEGKPDFKYMEDYVKNKEKELKAKYKKYILYRLIKIENFFKEDKEWKEFEISEIFDIKPGKRLTKTNMTKGGMPFIGASDSKNGITEFVSNMNNSLDSNVLGVNYNGSVVENFYHPYKCLFSDDVKRFSLKNGKGNKYIYLFFKVAILNQKNKYKYGYKFNERRMQSQKIMLPVDKSLQPDYEYMENYMKYLEQQKLLKYLEFSKH